MTTVKMCRLLLVSVLAFILYGSLYGNENSVLFQEANNYYKNSQYTEALTLYEKILSKGVTNAAIYFNAGNSAFKLYRPGKDTEAGNNGYLAKAVLYYKRAQMIDPSDKDINFNLNFILKTTGLLEQTEEISFFKLLLFFYYYPEVKHLAYSAVITFFLFCSMLGLAILFKNKKKKIFLYFALGSFLFWSVLFPAAIIKYNKIYKNQDAVVLHNKAMFLKEPVPGSDAVSSTGLSEGMIVTIDKYYKEDLRPEWVFVILANGIGGWTPSASVQKICF